MLYAMSGNLHRFAGFFPFLELDLVVRHSLLQDLQQVERTFIEALV